MMKKIFSIITAVFAVAVTVLLTTLACVKRNVPLNNGQPYRILVYNHSTTALKSLKTGEVGYSKEDSEYSEILNKLNSTTTLSLFDWLIHENTLNLAPSQDLNKTFSSYTTEMKSEYIAVELWFAGENAEQDVVVWIDGVSKVISYNRIILIIPSTNNYSNIVAYFSLDSNDWESQYKSCQPIILKGRAGELVSYIKTLG